MNDNVGTTITLVNTESIPPVPATPVVTERKELLRKNSWQP